MDKIIKALLEVKYPNLDSSVLLEIISVTPNQEIATEMLCGLYQEPEITKSSVKSDSQGVLTFSSYDKWNDRVHYKYMKAEQKSAYFPRSVKKEDVTLENFDSLKCSYKEGETHTLYVNTGKIEERQDYMTFSRWENLPYEPTEAEKKENL